MINLDKENPRVDLDKEVNCYKVKLRWGQQTKVGDPFDLDCYAAVLPGEGQGIPTDKDLVYQKALMHPSGCAKHSGDDLTGAVGEDIFIYPAKIPANRDRVLIAIEVAYAQTRHQTFGDIKSPKCIIENADAGIDEITIDLEEDFTTENCMVAFEIYRKGSGFKVKRVAAGYAAGLKALLEDEGFEVDERHTV
jgi:tellurium resistance protein TerD